MNGTIFDIKEFSTHDGPGARVTVFLKGCPLRCAWCHNPEGLSPVPQLLFKENLCTKCGKCYEPCSHESCRAYGRCLHACPNGCLEIAGRVYSSAALAEKLLTYAPMLNRLGGGITFSGGEPLYQAEFLFEVLTRLKDKIHTAIETSGYTKETVFKSAVLLSDFVIMDIKLADREEHKKYTGVYNDRIVENLQILKESGKSHVIRVPLIPGYTDTAENLKGISAIVGSSPCELLSYNEFAPVKYPQVGLTFPLEKREKKLVDISIFENAVLCKF